MAFMDYFKPSGNTELDNMLIKMAEELDRINQSAASNQPKIDNIIAIEYNLRKELNSKEQDVIKVNKLTFDLCEAVRLFFIPKHLYIDPNTPERKSH